MKSHPRWIAVFGYGCHLHPRYINYLKRIVEFVEENPSVRVVFFSGGETFKSSAPGKTEAQVMSDYFCAHYSIKDSDLLICKDIFPTTTIENIQGLMAFLGYNGFDLKEGIIFCDHCRAFKIRCLVKIISSQWPKTLTYDITANSWAKLKQYALATPLNILSLLVPSFRTLENWRRQKQMENW